MIKLDNFLGACYIIFGTIIAIVTIGELLLRIIIACGGIWLINKGLIIRGSHQLRSQVTTFFFKQRWF